MKTDATSKLRHEVRAERRSLAPKLRMRHSQSLARHLLRNPLLWSTRRMACFWPNDGEVDLRVMFKRLEQRGIQLLLPVIDGPRLWFAPFSTGSPMRSNRFGIAEPAMRRTGTCPLLAIDVVLMPLVAFDHHGNRVGMGGGYYDRTLASFHGRTHLHGPQLLGAAFEFQRRRDLPVQPWDIPMHGVITEQGLRWFRGPYK